MDAKKLRRKGQEILFSEDLGAYQRAVEKIVWETKAYKDLGDPQVVIECVVKLTDMADELTDKWWEVVSQAKSDDDDPEDDVYEKWERIRKADALNDDHPDPEPSEDSGDVGFCALAKSDFESRLLRMVVKLEKLLVRE